MPLPSAVRSAGQESAGLKARTVKAQTEASPASGGRAPAPWSAPAERSGDGALGRATEKCCAALVTTSAFESSLLSRFFRAAGPNCESLHGSAVLSRRLVRHSRSGGGGWRRRTCRAEALAEAEAPSARNLCRNRDPKMSSQLRQERNRHHPAFISASRFLTAEALAKEVPLSALAFCHSCATPSDRLAPWVCWNPTAEPKPLCQIPAVSASRRHLKR